MLEVIPDKLHTGFLWKMTKNDSVRRYCQAAVFCYNCIMMESKNEKKKMTMQDIADMVGVSKATVSYVLNNKPGARVSEQTRSRVLHTANLFNFAPNFAAKYLSLNLGNPVGLILGGSKGGLGALHYAPLVSGITGVLARRGCGTLLLHEAPNGNTQYPFDALVAINLSRQEIEQVSKAVFVPLVLIDALHEDVLFIKLYYDYKSLYAQAAKVLGGPHFALVTGPMRNEPLYRSQTEGFEPSRVHRYQDPDALQAFVARAAQQGLKVLFLSPVPALMCAALLDKRDFAVVVPEGAALFPAGSHVFRLPVGQMAGQIADILEILSSRDTDRLPQEHTIPISLLDG